mmetsp:Transcript_34745/g.77991  ORF Transcript_34745/g.77991 Transcript_34745/m.77991 type:complete len:262 (-) Transcript_34745:184-969(-)
MKCFHSARSSRASSFLNWLWARSLSRPSVFCIRWPRRSRFARTKSTDGLDTWGWGGMPRNSSPVAPFLSGTVQASRSRSTISGTVTVVQSNRCRSRTSSGTPGNICASRNSGPRLDSITALPVTLSMTYFPCCILAMPVSGSVMIVVTSGWASPAWGGMSETEAGEVTVSPRTPSSGPGDFESATGTLGESTSALYPISPPPVRVGSLPPALLLGAPSSSRTSDDLFFFFFLFFLLACRLYRAVLDSPEGTTPPIRLMPPC